MGILKFLDELQEAVEDLKKQKEAREQYFNSLKNKRRFKR